MASAPETSTAAASEKASWSSIVAAVPPVLGWYSDMTVAVAFEDLPHASVSIVRVTSYEVPERAGARARALERAAQPLLAPNCGSVLEPADSELESRPLRRIYKLIDI